MVVLRRRGGVPGRGQVHVQLLELPGRVAVWPLLLLLVVVVVNMMVWEHVAGVVRVVRGTRPEVSVATRTAAAMVVVVTVVRVVVVGPVVLPSGQGVLGGAGRGLVGMVVVVIARLVAVSVSAAPVVASCPVVSDNLAAPCRTPAAATTAAATSRLRTR